MNDTINYYELLGVSKNATEEEIKRAYRVQAKKWHPDINKEAGSQDMFKELVNAKDTLLDEEKRKKYDESLIKKQTPLKKASTSNVHYKEPEPEQEQEKFYTKWQYFKLYLKYYQNSKLRKALALFLVLLETIICSILGFINLIIVYIFAYTKELISYASGIFLIIYVVLLLTNQNLINLTFMPNDVQTNVTIISIAALLIFFPYFLFKFCIEKMPRYLSSLNIYLFKKSIGYKK